MIWRTVLGLIIIFLMFYTPINKNDDILEDSVSEITIHNIIYDEEVPIISTNNKLHPLETEQSIRWLALNIYYEARGEPERGKKYVAYVTLNRVYDNGFPNTIKEVVTQPKQFSWYKGYVRTPQDEKSWEKCLTIAKMAIMIYIESNEPLLHNALWYHNHAVNPSWANSFNPVKVAYNHIFYTRRI